MIASYRLEDLDTRQPDPVVAEARQTFRRAFPASDDGFMAPWFRLVAALFGGQYPGYQAMDTVYHDLEHTLQATLCWIRLMANRHRTGVAPSMTPEQFETGLVAILMHDTGYLKDAEDRDGTGAKFTFVHERRSCELARLVLQQQAWPADRIVSVQHLISCTGPRAVIATIPFRSEIDRIMGLAVCTADYLGQMSDPRYPEKLVPLFREFQESDEYRGIPPDKRLFRSAEEMLRKTPAFWNNLVLPKLRNECGNLCQFLAEPFPDGPNPYLDKVEENVDQIRRRVEQEYPRSVAV